MQERHGDQVGSDVECDLCKTVVTVIRTLVEANKSKEEIASTVAKVCENLKIEDQRVCLGITNVYKARDLCYCQDFTVQYS